MKPKILRCHWWIIGWFEFIFPDFMIVCQGVAKRFKSVLKSQTYPVLLLKLLKKKSASLLLSQPLLMILVCSPLVEVLTNPVWVGFHYMDASSFCAETKIFLMEYWPSDLNYPLPSMEALKNWALPPETSGVRHIWTKMLQTLVNKAKNMRAITV